jgi:hypothetical protein
MVTEHAQAPACAVLLRHASRRFLTVLVCALCVARRGGHDWWQNVRAPYYNTLPSGDFDVLQSLLNKFRATLPAARCQTQHYFNFTGAFWSEYTSALGLTHTQSYGCNRGQQGGSEPFWYSEDPWNHYNYQGNLDLSGFILDHFMFTQDAAERIRLTRFLPTDLECDRRARQAAVLSHAVD